MAKKSTARARNQSQNLQAACGGLDNALPYTNLCCVLKLSSRQINRSVMPVLYFVIACFQFYVGLLFPVCVVRIVIIVWIVFDDACIWQILLLWLLWFLSASFCLPSCARPVHRIITSLTQREQSGRKSKQSILFKWCRDSVMFTEKEAKPLALHY